MNDRSIYEDLQFLTETIVSPVEKQIQLRSTLAESLSRLGYPEHEINEALDSYYRKMRTLH